MLFIYLLIDINDGCHPL